VPFELESCITIRGVDKVCSYQKNLAVIPINTCPDTIIFPQMLSSPISVMQGNINTSQAYATWPWLDSIGND